MTATATTVETEGRRPASLTRRATFVAVCRSEWTKLRTVRSTWWTAAATVALTVGVGALTTGLDAHKVHHSHGSPPSDPAAATYLGLQFAQLTLGVLGVLVMSSEYATNMIRTTLTAVPNRLRLLSAKAAVFGLVTFVGGLVIAACTFWIGAAFLDDIVPGYHFGLTAHFGHGGTIIGRTILGAALYLASIGVLGVALGALIRRTAGAVVVLVCILYVLPYTFLGLAENGAENGGVFATIYRCLPTPAGQQMFLLNHSHNAVHNPWAGLAILVVWTVMFLVAAAALFEVRDA